MELYDSYTESQTGIHFWLKVEHLGFSTSAFSCYVLYVVYENSFTEIIMNMK